MVPHSRQNYFQNMKSYLWITILLTTQCRLSSSQNSLQQIIPKEAYQQYGLALEAIFGMGIRLQALLDTSKTQNFVVSPLSATIVIGQLMLGAEGEFRDQLYDLLSLPNTNTNSNTIHHYTKDKNETHVLPHAYFHLQLSSLIKTLQKRKVGEQFTLNQNNALFYDKDIELRKFFKKCITRLYDSELLPLDFKKDDTTGLINSWASLHTNGLIKQIISNPLDASTSSLFLNSIYFLAEWEQPFSDELNKVDKFFTNENNKTVETTYMIGFLEKILYAESMDYKLICLPYLNKELGMYIMLPNQDNPFKYDVKQFAQNINIEEVLKTMTAAKTHDVTVKIPKLSLSNTMSILEPLQKYREYKKVLIEPRKGNNNSIDNLVDKIHGYQNFTSNVQGDIILSGAAKNENFQISSIVQQMVFSINEKGTEAAAVTAGIIDYIGGAKTFVLNRPFTFFIRHEATSATIFWGTISDPSQK